ncbi:hypothetical protein P9112_007613 [Eukaryota sp. TZLM1-RC]
MSYLPEEFWDFDDVDSISLESETDLTSCQSDILSRFQTSIPDIDIPTAMSRNTTTPVNPQDKPDKNHQSAPVPSNIPKESTISLVPSFSVSPPKNVNRTHAAPAATKSPIFPPPSPSFSPLFAPSQQRTFPPSSSGSSVMLTQPHVPINRTATNTSNKQNYPPTPQEPGDSEEQKPVLTGTTSKILRSDSISFSINLAEVVFEKEQKDHQLRRALCRPDFAIGDSGIFITGTQDIRPEAGKANLLIISDIKKSPTSGELFCSFRQSMSVHAAVRDVHFLDHSRAVIAAGDKLAILVINFKEGVQVFDSSTIQSFSFEWLPPFHTDEIREICIHPSNRSIIASCGFDGQIFVLNLTSITQPQISSSFKLNEVVGSVRWNPFDTTLLSVTTDSGLMYTFDTQLNKTVRIIPTNKKGLFTHCPLSKEQVLFGFDDGTIHLHDVSKNQHLISFHDISVTCIGDIHMFADVSTSLQYLTCSGIGGVTLWSVVKDQMSVVDSGKVNTSCGGPDYYSSSCFVPFMKAIAVTDSEGNFIILKY